LFVSFAAGTMLSAAFFDVLPEAVEAAGAQVLGFALLGIVAFFAIERFLHWHHFHHSGDVHAMSYLNMVGDSIHNFMDGAAIAVSFAASVPIGIATTIAIIAHEIPQELGDFAILLYGGFSKKKALAFNFLTALAALAGAVAAYFVVQYVQGVAPFLLAFAAGGFIYIATADLVPELHKERSAKKMVPQFVLFLAGSALILALKMSGIVG
ncbi:MAG: ZIP family metal transporter, partial [Candidatus Diapherotrites archaeon]